MNKYKINPDGREKGGAPKKFAKDGRNRLSEGKLPACAEMCSTKALLGGDADVLSDIYRQRVTMRAARGTAATPPWGWDAAYGRPDAVKGQPVPNAAPPSPATTGGKS